MAETYSMDEEKKKDDELVFGQRDFDVPRREVTMKDFEDDPQSRQKRENRFIRTEKGTLARRGTATAQRAENIEKNRKRAQDAAKRRRQAKNK